MDEFKKLIEICAKKFGANVLNPSVIDFALAMLKNYLEKDYVKAISFAAFVLVSEHPFTDANKRVSSCFLLSALALKNYRVLLSKYDIMELFLKAARGEITKDEFVNIVKSNVAHE